MQFDFHWVINNIKTTTIEVLPYSGSGTLPQDQDENYLKTITPYLNSVPYNVCLIRYTTNEKGTHKIKFSATPMVNATEEFPYSLHITYNNGFPVELDVDPTAQENSKELSFLVVGSGETVANIYLDAVLTSLDDMLIGEYSSTVTIERITE